MTLSSARSGVWVVTNSHKGKIFIKQPRNIGTLVLHYQTSIIIRASLQYGQSASDGRTKGTTQGRQKWQKDLLLLSWHKETSWCMYTRKWTRIGPLQRIDRETQGMPERWRLHRQIKLGLAPALSHTPSLCCIWSQTVEKGFLERSYHSGRHVWLPTVWEFHYHSVQRIVPGIHDMYVWVK